MSKRCHPAKFISTTTISQKVGLTILPVTVPPQPRDAHDNVDKEEDGEEQEEVVPQLVGPAGIRRRLGHEYDDLEHVQSSHALGPPAVLLYCTVVAPRSVR